MSVVNVLYKTETEPNAINNIILYADFEDCGTRSTAMHNTHHAFTIRYCKAILMMNTLITHDNMIFHLTRKRSTRSRAGASLLFDTLDSIRLALCQKLQPAY